MLVSNLKNDDVESRDMRKYVTWRIKKSTKKTKIWKIYTFFFDKNEANKHEMQRDFGEEIENFKKTPNFHTFITFSIFKYCNEHDKVTGMDWA